MDTIEQKLDELEALIKNNLMPQINTPNLMPKIIQPAAAGRPKGPSTPKSTFQAPKTPGIAPDSKKNPVKVAQQLTNPEVKETRIKQLKENLKFTQRGQWSLAR